MIALPGKILLPLFPFCIIADLDDVTVKYNEKYMTIRRNLHTYNMVTLPYGFQANRVGDGRGKHS